MSSEAQEANVTALDYLVHLGRQEFRALGFIPRPKLEAYWRHGQIWLAHEHEEPCGYLCFGDGWPVLRIYQACVAYDVRRREHAAALVQRLIAEASHRGYEAISLWCAADLEANAFWQAMGFTWAGCRAGGQRRGRVHDRWVFRLPHPLQLALPWG